MRNLLRPLHSGFIFLEVILAIAMVGVMLTSILSLQSTIYSRVLFNARRIERLLPLKIMGISVLIEPLTEDEYTREKTHQDPVMTMVYQKELVRQNSSLSRFKQLFTETITGNWDEWKGPQKINIVRFLFVPEKGNEQGEKK